MKTQTDPFICQVAICLKCVPNKILCANKSTVQWKLKLFLLLSVFCDFTTQNINKNNKHIIRNLQLNSKGMNGQHQYLQIYPHYLEYVLASDLLTHLGTIKIYFSQVFSINPIQGGGVKFAPHPLPFRKAAPKFVLQVCVY